MELADVSFRVGVAHDATLKPGDFLIFQTPMSLGTPPSYFFSTFPLSFTARRLTHITVQFMTYSVSLVDAYCGIMTTVGSAGFRHCKEKKKKRKIIFSFLMGNAEDLFS